MSTTTIIVLNGIIAVGLLAALALVMHVAHRVAGSENAGAAHWSRPLELQLVRGAGRERDLERAA